MTSSPLRRCGLLLCGLPLAAGALLVGCASAPPPDAQMAVSRAAIERAVGPGAAEAPAEMAAARDKLARANVAYGVQDFALARRLASEAEVDAILAESMARSQRSGRALAEVQEGIRMLRVEMAKPVSQ